jgi:predicted RNase H-like HicB family nuclease
VRASYSRRQAASAGYAIMLVEESMKVFTAVIERCPETKLYVGYVPGFPGAHSQGESLDELNANLREVIEMLLEDDESQTANGG